ncbi:MAG: efflux RND transporter periplasmic adaptor subunit [Planctomycetota bacterium JB042]
MSRTPQPSATPVSPRLAGGVGLLALLLSGADAAGQAPPPAAVYVDVVRAEVVQPRERVIGSLRAAATATLAALEEGPLVELRVKEAAVVAAGDLLARTDTRRMLQQEREQKARVAEARARIASRRAELENLRRDLEALETAARQNAVSLRDLRNARTAVESGEAGLRATEQTLAALEAALAYLAVRISDAEIRAPFAGRVVERLAEPGEWVRAGDPLVTLQSVGTIEAWLEVPERVLDRLVTDPSATHVEFRTGEIRPVTRLRVLPLVDERARTFFLIADIDDPNGELSPGQSAAAWIPVGPAEEEILVPKDALVRRGGGASVVRVRGGEAGPSAEPVPVEVRFELVRHVVVAPGALQPGDELVVEGNERLLPGAPLAPRRVESPDPVLRPGEVVGAADPSDS